MSNKAFRDCYENTVKLFCSASLRLCVKIIFLFTVPVSCFAQNYTIQLHSVDGNEDLLGKEIQLSKNYFSSASAYETIKNIIPTLQEKGYLASSIDSLSIDEGVYNVYVFTGKKYKWARISFDAISKEILTQTNLKNEDWSGRSVNAKQVSRISEKLLQWAENIGYPFAKVWLDVENIEEQGLVSGNFMLDKGAVQKIDTIAIHGDVNVSRSFLLKYLDLKQHDFYDEKKLRNISPRIRELSFLQESAPWTVAFKLSQNTLDIYLRGKKANQINAIIGLLPNSSETGKFLLTVDAQFAFQNILSYGESIAVSYQNLQYKSPRLKADVVYPFLLNTPFGLDAHFDLYKKDTSFRRTSFQAGVRYQLSTTDYLRVFYQNQSNRLITIDTAFVKANKRLPDNIDVAANGAGIELGINRTDYRISPRRGWETNITVSALIRKVRKSDAITSLRDVTNFDYASLYDTVAKRQNQYFINGHISYYLSIGKKVVFKSSYNGGWVGGADLFRNELYQIGGFKLLRGFDEQSIFTNQYHVLSLELRLLLDQNSYFYLFSDNGYVRSDFNGFFKDDIYNGFGIGTTLETKSGLFTISFGLGRNNENPLQFRQSKIHFGYVAYF